MSDHTNPPSPELGPAEVRLLGELRLAGALDAPPPEVIAAAKAVIVWRTLDAELAELAYDSSQDDLALAGMRGAGATSARRSLTFEAAGVTLEVEAITAGSRRRLVGQLLPPQPGRVDVRHRDGSVTVAADEAGRFSADGLPSGPVSLRCQGIGQEPVSIVTDWVLV
jgi:hypothetical protein